MGLTAAQARAIAARGNVIVVAGAGTGKTSTLVERCLTLIGEGCSIENILMVTFTEAAAAEMRHRLADKLAAAAAQATPERMDWWQEQLALLDTARICTLHGFCLQLVRENFHLLGIDPAVKILDEQQTRPLIEAALDACFEPHFAGAEEASVQVREVIQRYGQGEVERIRTLILKLHAYAQSLAAPAQWFAEQQAALAEPEPALWRQWLDHESKAWAESWQPELSRAASTAPNLARCAAALERWAKEGGVPADCLAEIGAADGDWPAKKKTKLRPEFAKFFAEAEFLASQFVAGGMEADWSNVRRPLEALVSLARDFGAKFAAAKRELGGIDFADLEQFALRLLWAGEGTLTPVAEEWRGRLAQVFVDECQDINAAQDAILRAVSGEQERANRFLVGDVKQSIYQFRLARPALFRGYEAAWGNAPAGERILLAENFRSDPQIIRFVNEFFAPLMREEVGGVDYEPLVAGRGADAGAQADEPESGCPAARCVEFHLIPKGGAETEGAEEPGEAGPKEVAPEDLLAVEREARLVALRMRALHESGLEIWDKDAKVRRRVEWRDMAVLLRSPRSRVEAFAQEFHKCGVPLQAARGGFLASTEISDLLSLLRLLDNPLQDIPLLAVLRSPLVALSLDELAEVRAASREKRFWTALREFHRVTAARRDECPATALSAWEKVEWFLQRFAVWRELSRQVSLSQCLETALRDAHYEAVVAAGERGAERAANIRKFVATVRQYDPYQRQGLFRFLKFVAALEAAEQDIEPAPAQAQNAVRLMSIHQSKGLEFPVVVVACLGGLFNVQDLSRDVLLDEQFGLCAKAAPAGTSTRHPTLAHWLAVRRQRQQLLGEELRLLYVAMTRARDRLVLTATAGKADHVAWEPAAPRALTNLEILRARSPLDWLMSWLPMFTRLEDWCDEGGTGKLLSWRIATGQDSVPTNMAGPAEVGAGAAVDPAAVECVKRRVHWVYPHGLAASVTAKMTVTALRRRATELRDEEAGVLDFARPPRRRAVPVAGGLGASEIGTLHHRFLQRVSLAGAGEVADLRAQADELVARRVLSPTEAAALDLPALARFWAGAVGQEIRTNLHQVMRELPFTARFESGELERLSGAKVVPAVPGEFVVVQGVADLVVLRDTEIWLLDFKTDRVRAADLVAKVDAYRPQLRIYAAALAAIYQRPVTRSWLHFLAVGETVAV